MDINQGVSQALACTLESVVFTDNVMETLQQNLIFVVTELRFHTCDTILYIPLCWQTKNHNQWFSQLIDRKHSHL